MSQPIRLFAFGGFTGKLMGLGPGRLARRLAPLGIEAHLFTDRTRRMFLEGSDAHASEAEMLDDLRARMGDGPAVFAGSSGGGYGALRAAAALGCRNVIGFSAFTRFDRDATFVDPRGRKALTDLWRAEPDDARRDAANLWRDAGTPPRAVLHYAEGNAADAFQAESFARLPGVVLRPLSGDGHNLVAGEVRAVVALIRDALPVFGLTPLDPSAVRTAAE